jgi:5-deoxy-D-glucuronate isomerase
MGPLKDRQTPRQPDRRQPPERENNRPERTTSGQKSLAKTLATSEAKQVSVIDPDARLLSKRGQTIAGYNVQIAVDAKHKLIVTEAVTQDGNDSQQLMPMTNKAQDILASENLAALTDSGY